MAGRTTRAPPGSWWILGDALDASVSRAGRRCLWSGALLLAGARSSVVRTELAGAQQVQTFSQQFLEFRDRPALTQHVPVRTCRLLLLDLRPRAIGTQRFRAAPRALPDGRGLGLLGEGQAERVLVAADIAHLLAGGELHTGLVLEALRAQSRSAQRAISHCCSSRSVRYVQ